MKKLLLLLVLFFGSNNIIKSQHPDGTILPREISRFENGNSSWESEMVIIKNKKYNIGWYRNWYENGQLCFEKYYHNPGCINNPKFKDQPALRGITKICSKPFADKTWRSFYENGDTSYIKKHKSKYTKDGVYYTQLLEATGWFKNGQKSFEESYHDNDSLWYEKKWHENGQIKSEIIYQRAFKKSQGYELNLPINKHEKYWHSNGNLLKEINYFMYPKISVCSKWGKYNRNNCYDQEIIEYLMVWNKDGKIITKNQYILLVDDSTNNDIKKIYKNNWYEKRVSGFEISQNMLLCKHGDFINNDYSDYGVTKRTTQYNRGEKVFENKFSLNQFSDTTSKNGNYITYLYDSNGVNILRMEDSLINLIDVYSTGKIKSKINYLDGKRDIVVIYPNGAKKLEYSYLNNELNGSFNAYYADGSLYCRLSYVEGKLDGDCSFFYNNDQIKADIRFNKGKLDGEQRYYYRNGKIQDRHRYKNGKLDGAQKSYFINGNTRLDVFVEESTFKNRNEIITLNQNMKLAENEDVYDALIHLDLGNTAIDVSYYYDSVYINIDSLDFQNGSKTTYYKSGQIKSAEYFRNSKRDGKQSYYRNSGDILSIEWYSNGDLLPDYVSMDLDFELPRFDWREHVQNNIQTNIEESYEYYNFETKINEYSLSKNIINILQKLSYNNQECQYSFSRNKLVLDVKINLPREKQGMQYKLDDFNRDFMGLIEESNISSKFKIYITLNGEDYNVLIDDTPLISLAELDLRSNLSHCDCILAYDVLLYEYINFIDENINLLLTKDESRNPIKGMSKDKKKEYKSLKSLYSKIRKRCKKTNVYITSSDDYNHILFYINDDLNQYLNCERFIPLERRLIRYNHISSHYIDLFY